jgi:hypothetical protein
MFEYIESLFVNLKSQKGDINEHLETLKNLASECNSVVEFGVRWMVSVIALAVSGCKELHAYDTEHPAGFDHNRFKELEDYCEKYDIYFEFNKSDVLEIDTIPECDMLFVDTFHTYSQLKCELFLFSSKVKKYIVIHDTTFYEELDDCSITKEAWFEKYKDNKKVCSLVNFESEKTGLNKAIEEFLESNNEWKLFKKYTNNNGLTVLKRN